jgi:hypothetical protein
MKQCPVCEKTYDDNMRFCQTDGTALVEKAAEPPPEPVDPYKTMVASKADIAAAIPPLASSQPPQPSAPAIPEPSVPSSIEDEILEIPRASDPNKTQVVTEAELRAEMERFPSEERLIEIPPATDDAPSDIPITGDAAGSPPPSPFSTPSAVKDDEPGPANFPTSPPIPSPFAPHPPASDVSQPEPEAPVPAFVEPEPAVNPFEQPAASAPLAQAEFDPASSPEPNMQNPQNFGQQQFTPPAAGGGQNSTLAIISLVCGILGLTVCCGSFVVSLVAIVLGFMARGKANSDPASYGGAGLALAGIITGALGLLGSLVVIALYFFGFAASMMQNM